MRILAPTLLVAFPLACGGTPAATNPTNSAGPSDAVAEVVDGDTIVLADGRHVRLVQIDAPEVPEGECYGAEAKHALESILPRGAAVRVVADPALDSTDRFGRTLAYAVTGGLNVNVELVRRGAAAPYFFRGDRGRYANALVFAATQAQDDRRGLWGACPGTVLDPSRQVDARP